MSKRKFRSPPTFVVIRWKDGKWRPMSKTPVLRPVAVQLVASAWKEGCVAQMKESKQSPETPASNIG